MMNTRKIGNPFVVYCKNCGAPTGYDISRQSYRCPHCGETSGIEEAQKGFHRWRWLQAESLMAEKTTNQQRNCPNCGAVVLFPEGEATNRCVFCGSALVREEFEQSENFPEMIIPFVLTKEEAREQLQKWCGENKRTPEAKAVMQNLHALDGWYLPYQMVRGPVDVTIHRDAAQRVYHCDGFLEQSMVCTAEKLDNMVLEAAEPFDPNGLVPFEHGYIAGHKARLQDISAYSTNQRVMEEVSEDYRPYVEKVMQTKGCELVLQSENLMSAPVLIPMYLIHVGELFAVVNGQTGKLAVSLGRKRTQIIKLVEPTVLTLICLVVSFWFCRGLGTFEYCVQLPLMITFIFSVIVFGVKDKEIRKKLSRIILSSAGSRARRENKELVLQQGEDVFRNPFPNIPSFYEWIDGMRTTVDIRFYPPVRIFEIIWKALFMLFLPYPLAFFLRLFYLDAWAHPMTALMTMDFGNGVIWLIFMFGVIPLAYMMMYRQGVYNHPFLYRIEDDGSRRLVGNAGDRRITFRGHVNLVFGEQEAKKIVRLYGLVLAGAGFLSVLMLVFFD